MEKESRLWLGALWEWLWLGTSLSSILQEGCAGDPCLSCNPGCWLWGCFCADGEVKEEWPPPLSPEDLMCGQFWWGLGSQLRSWGWGCSTTPSSAICRDPSSMSSREGSKSQRSEHNRFPEDKGVSELGKSLMLFLPRGTWGPHLIFRPWLTWVILDPVPDSPGLFHLPKKIARAAPAHFQPAEL